MYFFFFFFLSLWTFPVPVGIVPCSHTFSARFTIVTTPLGKIELVYMLLGHFYVLVYALHIFLSFFSIPHGVMGLLWLVIVALPERFVLLFVWLKLWFYRDGMLKKAAHLAL